jgi:HEAT repeat protein
MLLMSTFAQNRDNRPGSHSQSPAGEDLLPPVEPPSAGFIIQLFVVPALIVLVIVGVWLSFNWLVRRTATRPQDLIQGLEQGPSIARWQRASELADMLRNERFAEFRKNPDAAAHVARILDREIESGGMNEDEVEFRKYLAYALGEFEVQQGIDVLLKAAQTERDPREVTVRDAALRAIAVRIYNLRQLDAPQELTHPELEPALLRLAGDEDPAIRLQAAFALGHLGTPAAIERLEVMVDDPHADTRYNAAVALAVRGNAKAVETLAEMLDLEEMTSGRQQINSQTEALHQGVNVRTAIAAAQDLARQNPDADLSPVIEALERLAEADPGSLTEAQLPPRLISDARGALTVINRALAGNARP